MRARECQDLLAVYLDHQMKYQSEWLDAAALLITGKPPVYSDEGQAAYWSARSKWCDWAASDAVRTTVQAIADRTAGDRRALAAALAGAPF